MIDVTEHIELVRKLARMMYRKHHRDTSLDDLEGDGMVGLVKAGKSYDESNGASFQTYAQRRILGEMQDGLRRADCRSRRARRSHEHCEMLSFDTPVKEDQDATYEDTLSAPVRDPLNHVLIEELDAMCPTEKSREAFQSMLIELNIQEAAAMWNCSYAAASQRRFVVVRMLREKLGVAA